MRRTKRAYAKACRIKNACQGEHGGRFERSLRCQRRQQAGQTLRQHGFATARRPGKKQGMSTCRRYLECPLGAGLTAHISQIRHNVGGNIARFRMAFGQRRLSAKMRTDG